MNAKHQLFVAYYLGEAKHNATRAAELAGYRHANNNAIRLMKRPDIQAAISSQVQPVLESNALEGEDVLRILSEQATGSLKDFLELDPKTGKLDFDLGKAERLGRLHLVKSITRNQDGSIKRIELYDSQRALELIGKALGLFRDHVQVDVNIDRSAARAQLLEKLAKLLADHESRLDPPAPMRILEA